MSSTISNLLWKFSERIVSQLIAFVVSIVIARILAPSDYGLIAMVMVVINLSYVLVDGGFSSALIQKKDADRLDFSTVFYFSLVFAAIIYGLIYFSASYIAKFYGSDYAMLTPILRVLGIQVIIYSINSVQTAYVSRKMLFKNFFWATLVGNITSGIIGLIMAYSGYGVWALVFQALFSSSINTITLYIVTKKLPGLEFSYVRLKSLFNYGINLLGASFLTSFFLEFRSFVIGKLYSSSQLAFFDRGRQFPVFIGNNITVSVGTVLFPKMSQFQDNSEYVKEATRKSIRFCAFIMCPLMLGLAAVAEPLVHLLLTDKWLPCVPFIQIFCVIYLFQPIHIANMQAIKAMGYSGVYFKLELIKKSIEIVSLLCVMWVSVEAIAINMAILTTLFTFVNAYPNIKILNYSVKEQLLDIVPPLLMSIVLFLSVYCLNYLTISQIILFPIQIVTGLIIYLFLSIITKNKEFYYLCSLCKLRKIVKI